MTATASLRPHYDCVIVGARCAGAATAMLLARAGLRVLAVDRRPYGADALSTHALMRAGVVQLHRWGVLARLRAEGTPAVRTTTFYYGDDAEVVPIVARGGIDALYAPRRTVLDRVLADAAIAAGADVRFGVAVRSLRRAAGGRVTGVVLADAAGDAVEVAADLVIGADGTGSYVAAEVGARAYREAVNAGATAFAYYDGLPATGYHWYWNPGIAAGVIPTNDGQACVFVAGTPARLGAAFTDGVEPGFLRLLAEATPRGADVLAGARRVTAFRRFAGVHGYLRRAVGPGWALVGDAGYFKDPITAHGITDALRDAELLARAVVDGSTCALAGYQTTRDELSIAMFDVTDQVAAYTWDLPALRRLHGELSDAMRAEVRAVAAFDEPVDRAA